MDRVPTSIAKLQLRPEEAANLLSIGWSKVYELIGTGELASVRIGASGGSPPRPSQSLSGSSRTGFRLRC
jgi:excisionase family DNA binding protein